MGTDADVGTETDFGVTGDVAMAEEEFVREHGVHSEYRVSVAPTLLIVSALMAMALLRYYVVRGREKVLDNEALDSRHELFMALSKHSGYFKRRMQGSNEVIYYLI